LTGPDAANGGADQRRLLATKLHVPRLREGFVPRQRLVDALDEAAPDRIILVCAPAGFGKSALMAHWVRHGRSPVAWLSLDSADNDPARFWRHVLAALETVWPGIDARLSPLLGPPAPASFDEFVTALINDCAGADDRSTSATLVLDDFHVIDSPRVANGVAHLAEHRPPTLGLAVGSRVDPPLPLARLRARGQLTELRAEHLRFTLEESSALLREALGTRLADELVGALTARTEGWAAGLQLAGLSLRGKPDPARFVATFSGSHRFVLDYLAEEVLDRQPGHVTDFLLETSVLDRLNGALCDAVTDRSDGQEMLEAIERANLFLVSLDDVRGWWRYHQLFAELLRATLRHRYPDRVTRGHARAAAWHEEYGTAEDAVQHAIAAGDFNRATAVIERHADRLLLHSEGATIERWLGRLPVDVISDRPRLLLVQARLALLGGRADEAHAPLEAAEHALAAPGGLDDDYQPSIGPAASLLVNVPATIALDRAYLAELRGDGERAATFASRALSSIQDDQWMLRSHALGYLALAHWLRGRLPEAEQILVDNIARWRGAGEQYLAVRGCHHLGQLRVALGRLDAATEAYELAIDVASSVGDAAPAVGVGHVGLAELSYQRGDLDRALDHVEEGIRRCRHMAYRQPLANGLAIRAWIYQANGDTGRASVSMDEATSLGPMQGVSTLLNPVPAQWARLRIAQGEIAAVLAWLGERGVGSDDDASYAREPDHLILARALLAQRHPDRALALLDRLAVVATAEQRVGSLVEIESLRALAHAASGSAPAAVRALADALVLGCPQGQVRVFVDAGAPLATVLTDLLAAQRADATLREVPLACLSRVLSAFDPGTDARMPGGRQRVTVPGLVEQLTARELEVLALLATGETNRDIAAQLVVSLDTVKKHVGRVLDKLGATNRTEAVARARELDLIP
jgi:LuxR family maltose regulon positive regulatory protein